MFLVVGNSNPPVMYVVHSEYDAVAFVEWLKANKPDGIKQWSYREMNDYEAMANLYRQHRNERFGQSSYREPTLRSTVEKNVLLMEDVVAMVKNGGLEFGAGNKIQVIKDVRARTGMGLKDSKDMVEDIHAGFIS